MSHIENVKVGPDPKGLAARIIVSDTHSRIALSGARAYARLRLARALHGTKYDALVKDNFYVLDEAIRRPWAAAGDELQLALQTAGLEVTLDHAAAAMLEAKTQRILARFSRWWPEEDGSWRYDPGTIDPALKAEAQEGLRYLGWESALFPFAFDDVSEIVTKDNALLGPTMGYGKSRAFLAAAEYWRWKEGHSTPTIIIACKRHLGAWREELGGVKGKAPCELLITQYGPRCYEEWLTKERPRFNQPFLLISLERLKLLPAEDMQLLQEIARTSTIGIDEAYVISNLQSNQTRAAFSLSGAHHIAITGTPQKSRIQQLLPILQWTHRGGSIALPDYPTDRAGSLRRWTAKHATFARASEDGSRKQVPFIRNIEELHEILAPLMKRRLRGEPEVVKVLGEAVIVPERIAVDLDPQHRENYRAVLKQFSDWYLREMKKRGRGAFIPNNEILIKLGYLVWNVSSPWRMEDHSDQNFRWPAYPRQLTGVHRAAIEIVQRELEGGNRVILAGRATDPIDLMAETLNLMGIPTGVIHGKISDKRREEVIYGCRTGELQVLAGSMGTISEGLNLSFANRIITTEYPWDSSQLAQLFARITRGVQETEPKAYCLYAAGTIQEFMLSVCDLKADSISAALDRTAQSEDTSRILDLQQYVNSIVGVEGEEQVERREYELELEDTMPALLPA